MQDNHANAQTRFLERDGARFAYRRWGNAASGQPPLFFLQHFRGGMDHWDPLMTDGLAAAGFAKSRTVITVSPGHAFR